VLHAYFIARHQPEIETAAYGTLDGVSLSFVRCGNLVAAVRPTAPAARLGLERILEYNGIVAAASKLVTVLPLRLGARFRSESALRELLLDRSRELTEALDRLEGKAELLLRVPAAADEALHHKQAAGIAAIGKTLDFWFEVQASGDGRSILEIALLIERAQAGSCRARLRGYDDVTGPWPPLHFLPKFLRAPVRAERKARTAASRRAG
jgi:hypothetical protein